MSILDLFTAESLVRMSMELTLGLCIKLFCDNGRIHWRDFVNDFLFWVPGFQALPGDGLNRQVAAMVPPVTHEALPTRLAAK